MPTPSWFCPDTVEGVDEEWEDNCEEEAAEAASVAPSISGSSSGEVKTAPSASPVAAEPGPKGHSPACKGAETAGNHKHKVSKVHVDCPKTSGNLACPGQAARRDDILDLVDVEF